MKNFRLALTLFILSVVSINFLSAQEILLFDKRVDKVGFVVGYGDQTALDVTYDYRIYLFRLQLYHTMIKKEKWSLETLMQPQVNFTRYRKYDHFNAESKGAEVGINNGFLFRFNLKKDVSSIYALISSGPHFVTGVPKRQVKGFIFASYFIAGLTMNVSDKWHLDIRSGFRHISNIGFWRPNGGVNNFVINAGVFRIIEP